MTMAELDLAYSPSLRYYEAPPHLKANGGTFLIDDFGRQRIEPAELLNRWIIPLEHQVDHLTLAAGQKIEVPFRLMLIVATNLAVADVADPAFLRRMGYRVHIKTPDAKTYVADLPALRAARCSVDGSARPDGAAPAALPRRRPRPPRLRAARPDRTRRAKSASSASNRSQLTPEVLNTAWLAYFGDPSESGEEAVTSAVH